MQKLGAAALACAALALALSAGARAGDPPAGGLAAAAAKVKEKVLANGLRILVLERRGAPVIAFSTVVRTGAVDEPRGLTGVAHVFEHMAFKGSETVGTTGYAEEKSVLDALEAAFEKLKAARVSGDAALVAKLEKELDELTAKADKFVVHEEYSTVIQRHGGAGLNAWTAADVTNYHVELPSNRLELWFALEADRFLKPVLREFYKEKEAVKEERRLRTDSSPPGKLYEELLGVAFKAHPYGQPTIGHVSDLDDLSATRASGFFRGSYTPNNTTIALVGDVGPDEAFAVAEKYFGAMPRGPEPAPVHTVEPAGEGEKRVHVEAKAQPMLVLAFHRPSGKDKDAVVYQALSDLLAGGRTSRLYKALVVEKKVAVSVESFTDFPGVRYANLVLVNAVPAPGKSSDDCVKAIDQELARLRREPVAEDELEGVKVRARAGLIRQLRSPEGMAEQLAVTQATLGDWRELFAQVDRIAKVSREDVQRVAKTLFQKKNRVRGEIVPPAADSDEGAAGEPGEKKDAPGEKKDGAGDKKDAREGGE